MKATTPWNHHALIHGDGLSSHHSPWAQLPHGFNLAHIKQAVALELSLGCSRHRSSDTAIKRSAWLLRRVGVLEEGVTHGMIQPLHISEADMVADPYTKYLTVMVYMRLTHYANNFKGKLPPRPSKGS